MPDLAELGIRIRSEEAARGKKNLDDLAGASRRAEQASKRTESQFRKTDAATKSLRGSTSALFRVMGPLVGAISAVTAVRGAVRTLASFEQTLAQVRGIAIKTTITLAEQTRQFKALTDQAKLLGSTTRFTATEAGEAQLFLARAGFDLSEILEALPGTLDLAAAGVLELGTAADIASNVLSQFSLNADEMGRVGDVLVNTANSSNTSVLQLAEAMKFAGPIAGALGTEIEEASAAIGVLGDSGIQATLAGTQLRGILLALVNPTRKGQTILKSLAATIGESSDAFNVQKRSLTEVFEAFERANAGAEEFGELFGRRQAAGAIVLSNNVEKLKELTAANLEAEGASRRLAEIQVNTLAGSFRALKSAIEGLVLANEGLGGTLKDVVDLIVSVVRVLGGMEDQVTKNKDAAIALARAIEAVVKGIALLLGLRFLRWLALSATAVFKLNKVVAANPFVALTIAVAAFVSELERAIEKAGSLENVLTDIGAKLGLNPERRPTDNQELSSDAHLILLRQAQGGLSKGQVDFFAGRGSKLAKKVIEDLADAAKRARARIAAELEKMAADAAEFQLQVADAFQEIQREIDVLDLGEASVQIAEFSDLLEKAFGDDQKKIDENLTRYIDLLDQLEQSKALRKNLDEIKEAGVAFDELVKEAKDYLSLIGRSEKAARIIEAQRIAARAFGEDQRLLNNRMSEFVSILDEIDRRETALENLELRLNEVRLAARGIGRAFSDSINEFIFGEGTATEVLRALASDITQVFFDLVVTRPLTEMIANQLTPALANVTQTFTLGPQVAAAGAQWLQANVSAGATFTTSVTTAATTFSTSITAASAQLVASAQTAASILGLGAIGGGAVASFPGLSGIGNFTAPSPTSIPVPGITVGGCGPGG